MDPDFNAEESFNVFDLNKDGKITPEELGNILSQLGQSPTTAELEDMVADFDSEGKGFIDLADFKKLVDTKLTDHSAESSLKDSFNYFDRAGKGYITKDDLRMIMEKMGEEMTEQDLDGMMEVADKKKEKKIDYEDFVQIVSG